MSVGRICQREVDALEGGKSVRAAAERMRQHTVGCLVIVNRAQKPIGIVTDRDLAIRALADALDPCSTRIDEIMTTDPKTVTEATAVEDALRLLRHGAFRRLPVVSNDGKLVGMLTLDDILMLLAEELTQVGRLLGRETPRAAATAR